MIRIQTGLIVFSQIKGIVEKMFGAHLYYLKLVFISSIKPILSSISFTLHSMSKNTYNHMQRAVVSSAVEIARSNEIVKKEII